MTSYDSIRNVCDCDGIVHDYNGERETRRGIGLPVAEDSDKQYLVPAPKRMRSENGDEVEGP